MPSERVGLARGASREYVSFDLERPEAQASDLVVPAVSGALADQLYPGRPLSEQLLEHLYVGRGLEPIGGFTRRHPRPHSVQRGGCTIDQLRVDVKPEIAVLQRELVLPGPAQGAFCPVELGTKVFDTFQVLPGARAPVRVIRRIQEQQLRLEHECVRFRDPHAARRRQGPPAARLSMPYGGHTPPVRVTVRWVPCPHDPPTRAVTGVRPCIR